MLKFLGVGKLVPLLPLYEIGEVATIMNYLFIGNSILQGEQIPAGSESELPNMVHIFIEFSSFIAVSLCSGREVQQGDSKAWS